MDRFSRGHLLGRLLGRALPASQHPAAKADFHFEFFLVLGATLPDQMITGRLVPVSLSQPLKPALEILGQDIFLIQARIPEPRFRPLHATGVAGIEVYGADQRLDRPRLDGGLLPAARFLLPLAQTKEIAQPPAPENSRQRAAIHPFGTQVGQHTLVVRREILPEPFRHDELEDGVAQEFQPLVIQGGRCAFLGKGAVRQGTDEEFPVRERITDLGFDFGQGDAPGAETGDFPVSVVGGASFPKLRCFPLS